MRSQPVNKIAFVHEAKHVGGGQVFSDCFFKALTGKSDYSVDLIDELSVSVWWSILRGKYQVVVLNLYTEKWTVFALLIKLFGIKLCVISYGIWSLEFRTLQTASGFRLKKRLFTLTVAQSLMFWTADKIIVLSKYHQELMAKHCSWAVRKTTVVHGASEQKVDRLDPKLKIANKIAVGIDPSKRMFLLLARIERRKGWDIAIRAFAQAQAKNSILVLVFPMGLYNDYGYLLELLELLDDLKLSSRVHLCTGVPHEERFRFFRAADAFIMSSTTLETFGLTTIEAISNGCLLTGFATGAFREIVPADKQGFVSDDVSVPALARSIHEIAQLNAQDLFRLQSQYWKASKVFSWKKSGALLIREIEQLLS